MPTVFETLTDAFYAAFFEADSEKRRASIDAWVKDAAPVIQLAVENDIRVYIESILKDTWTPEGWKSRAAKFSREYNKKSFMDSYRLCLDVNLRQRTLADVVVGASSAEVRARTIEAARAALPEVKPTQSPKGKKSPSAGTTEDSYDEEFWEGAYHDSQLQSLNPYDDGY